MRASILGLVLALAACTPEVAPGVYLCGPEQLCPEGQACNGPDNVCVLDTQARPFACGTFPDQPGDDQPATAQDLGELPCVSVLRENPGCLPAGDTGDFYRFTVADGCTAVAVTSAVTFPIAFQPVELQLAANGTLMTIDTPCSSSRPIEEGEETRCLEMTLAPGETYEIGAVPTGADNCDNECAYNRYNLTLQLGTP